MQVFGSYDNECGYRLLGLTEYVAAGLTGEASLPTG